jgi:hypothetical protein
MPAPPRLAAMLPGAAHVSPKKKGKKRGNYGVFELCIEVGVGGDVSVNCHVFSLLPRVPGQGPGSLES